MYSVNRFYGNQIPKSNGLEDLITMYQKLNVKDSNDGHYIHRRSSLDSYHSDAESLSPSVSAVMSPIGSPHRLQRSPILSASIGVCNGNKLRESDLMDERENSKHDFNRNGIEVPLIKANPYERYITSNNRNDTYQLFGNNGFNLSQVSGNGSVGATGYTVEPMATHEPKPTRMQTELYAKMKGKPRRIRTQMFCSFCKNNNETKEMYTTHILKDPEGKTLCPILRKYNCPVCNNGGGDYAHTIRYCPRNQTGQCMPSVIKLLKNSRSSDGKRRNVFPK